MFPEQNTISKRERKTLKQAASSSTCKQPTEGLLKQETWEDSTFRAAI